MTSSNAITEPAPALDAPAQSTPEPAGDGSAAAFPAVVPPFELLPAGESFGVCDVDGVCS